MPGGRGSGSLVDAGTDKIQTQINIQSSIVALHGRFFILAWKAFVRINSYSPAGNFMTDQVVNYLLHKGTCLLHIDILE